MSLGAAHKYYGFNPIQAKSLSIRPKIVCHNMGSQLQRRGPSRYTCRKAVLTIETAIVLPFFVCFMVFILYFYRVLQTQAHIAQALQYASRKTAAEYSMPAYSDHETDKKSLIQEIKESDLNGMLKAKAYFYKQLKNQKCPTQFINRGILGISFLQSDFSEDYIELKAIYKMKLPVKLLGNIQFRIVQVSKCRKWTGYRPEQDMQNEPDHWLYYTEYGTVYHANRSCTHLDLSIRGISYTQVSSKRNSSGGKYHKCEKCGNDTSGNGMVYITDYGDRYHSSLRCSGLKRIIYMIRKSKATDKRMCSKCGG